jgi:hypothetical protein
MNWERRLGSVVLGMLGAILACLLVFMFVFENLQGASSDDPRRVAATDVAVFFLARSEWRIFHEAVHHCADPPRGLGRILVEDDGVMLVETTKNHQKIRFTWQDARGEGETATETRRLLRSDHPPVAIVGASDTVLTSALAEELRRDASLANHAQKPLLLVPWATSTTLLDTYPGRTFRFGSNNRRSAELLVESRFASLARGSTARVFILIDRRDPYSIDLARCFRASVEQQSSSTQIQERTDALAFASRSRLSGSVAAPSAEEQEFARTLWTEAMNHPDQEIILFLPLQNDPIRRIFAALNGAAPARAEARRSRLSVICGDSVGQTTLESYVHALAFPVWCLSTVSNLSAETTRDLADDVQILGELVSALLTALDEPEPPTVAGLNERLRSLRLNPDDRAAFGRPLSFLPGGERAWDSAEDVLILMPGSTHIAFSSRTASGSWTPPVPIPSPRPSRVP